MLFDPLLQKPLSPLSELKRQPSGLQVCSPLIPLPLLGCKMSPAAGMGERVRKAHR